MSVTYVDCEGELVPAEKGRVLVKEEERVWLTGTYQTSVLDVQVIKDGCDALLPIYGTISVSTYSSSSSSFSTIFNRRPEDPDYIVLGGDTFFSYLTLKEDDTHPPLWDADEFSIQMKLYQKEEEEEEEEKEEEETNKRERPSEASDTVIADTGMLTFKHWRHIVHRTCSRELEGKEGFKFKVSYVAVYGCRVRVSLKFNRIPNRRCRSPFSFCGIIAAKLSLADRFGDFNGVFRDASTRLFYRESNDPVKVEVSRRRDSISIPLDRSVTVAPIGFSCLTIAFKLLHPESNAVFAEDYVPFIFPQYDTIYFATNRERSHTKIAAGGLVSVTIDILNGGEEFKGEVDMSGGRGSC